MRCDRFILAQGIDLIGRGLCPEREALPTNAFACQGLHIGLVSMPGQQEDRSLQEQLGRILADTGSWLARWKNHCPSHPAPH